MAKILGKTHKPKVLGADTHSVSLMNKWRLRNSHTWLVGLVEHTFFFNIISNGKGTIFPKCIEKDHPNVDE